MQFLWSLTRYWARAPDDEPLECALPQYEMSDEEKQLLRVCMNSAEVAALALAAQGGASVLLSAAYAFTGEPGEAVSDAISAVQKLLTVRVMGVHCVGMICADVRLVHCVSSGAMYNALCVLLLHTVPQSPGDISCCCVPHV